MKKKLTYAFGEILIVIIGISLAFAMNKWGEERSNKAQREQYLKSLRQDIEEDKALLQQNLIEINKKLDACSIIIPALNTNDPQKNNKLKGLYSIPQLTNFTPKDFTYQALVNSGDLKLIDDLSLKKAIEKHYANYKAISNAYIRQETINKDYLGNYFINHVDYDLISEGKSPFKDEKLLKNMMRAVNGSFNIKRDATENGIKSCDNILIIL